MLAPGSYGRSSTIALWGLVTRWNLKLRNWLCVISPSNSIGLPLSSVRVILGKRMLDESMKTESFRW